MDETTSPGDGKEILRTTLGISKNPLTGSWWRSTMLSLSRTRQLTTPRNRSEHHGQPRREQRFQSVEGTGGRLGLGNEICGSPRARAKATVGCAPCALEHADRQRATGNPHHGRAACSPMWRKPKLPAGASFVKHASLRRFDFREKLLLDRNPTDSQKVSIRMIALSRSMLVDFRTLTETSSRTRAAKAA